MLSKNKYFTNYFLTSLINSIFCVLKLIRRLSLCRHNPEFLLKLFHSNLMNDMVLLAICYFVPCLICWICMTVQFCLLTFYFLFIIVSLYFKISSLHSVLAVMLSISYNSHFIPNSLILEILCVSIDNENLGLILFDLTIFKITMIILIMKA